jgi:hypothetical protein
MTTNHWDSLPYRRITEVRYHDGRVHVRFEDGDEVEVEAAHLLPDDVDAPDWDRVCSDGIELEVPTKAGPTYVFWETIRELTDPAYAAYLLDADALYRLQSAASAP